MAHSIRIQVLLDEKMKEELDYYMSICGYITYSMAIREALKEEFKNARARAEQKER